MFQNFAVQESFLWWWKHSVSCHLIWWSQHMWLPCSWIMSNVTEELIADPTGWQLILIYVYTYICLYCACECSWGCTRAQCNMWRSDVNLKFWCMRISTFKAVPLIDLDCCHRSQATWPTSFYELFCCLLPSSHHHGYRCAWFSTPVTFRYGAWLYFPWGNRVGEASLGEADEHTAKGGSTPRATSTLVLTNRLHCLTLGLSLLPLPRSGCSGLNDSVRPEGDTWVYLMGSQGTMTTLQPFLALVPSWSVDR